MAQPYGLLSAAFDYSNVAEDEFNEWYDTEHVPTRAAIEGFINARRWVGAENPKITVAIYDLESLEVLRTPAYRAIGGDNMPPWAKRVIGKSQRIYRFEAEQIVPGQKAAPADAGALLLVAVNIGADVEAEFNAWYNEEHLPRISQVPGCLCARRFKILSGNRRYLASYHLSSPEVQASQLWKEAANTAWSTRMRAHLRDPLRLVLRAYATGN